LVGDESLGSDPQYLGVTAAKHSTHTLSTLSLFCHALLLLRLATTCAGVCGIQPARHEHHVHLAQRVCLRPHDAAGERVWRGVQVTTAQD
jgi:hypothetical protein